MYGFLGYCLGTILLIVAIVRFLYPPLWRDLYTLYINLTVIRRVRKSCAAKDLTIDQFERQAQRRSDHILIIFKEKNFTYGKVNQQADRVAHALVSLDVGPGDTIALVMSNEPAFLWIYLGSMFVCDLVILLKQPSVNVLRLVQVTASQVKCFAVRLYILFY